MEADLYTYRVFWSEEDEEYVATCLELPSLSWLAESRTEAIAGIYELAVSCIQDMKSDGESIPEPIAAKSYSGKFMVRIPPQLHRELAIQAAESQVSLNRLVANKLAN